MSVTFSERVLERCDSTGKLEKILKKKLSKFLNERELLQLFCDIQPLLHLTANTAKQMVEERNANK